MKFTLPLPPTLNQCYRVGITKRGRIYRYKTAKAKDWEEEAMWLLKKAKGRRKMIEGPVEVFITLELRRDRDIDSSQKLLFDCMEKVGIFRNDKQISNLYVYKEKTKGKPEIKVKVYELEE